MYVRVLPSISVGALVLGVASLVLASPASAQVSAVPAAFPERLSPRLAVPAFTDSGLLKLQRILSAQLAVEKDPAKWGIAAQVPLWNFGRQLQAGRLSKAQEARVTAYIDRLARAHPDQPEAFDGIRRMIDSQLPGKIAPDIVGADLDGKVMRLSDLRGRVVVLIFSAEWCGICHTMNPYERLMQELYGQWPFTIVSVETGDSRDTVKKAKSKSELTYRSWWDAPRPDAAGAISTAWNAQGFPTIYVIDQAGVIRFVDVRYEDLLKAVKQVLNESPAETAPRAMAMKQ